MRATVRPKTQSVRREPAQGSRSKLGLRAQVKRMLRLPEEFGEATDLFGRLMGKKAEPGFQIIQENAAFAQEAFHFTRKNSALDSYRIHLKSIAMFRSTLLSLAAAVLLCGCTSSPRLVLPSDSLRDEINASLEKHNVPGAYVAVVHRGRLIFEEERGFETLASETAFTAGSSARLASATKVLSGLMFLSLAEDGKVDLDGSLGDWDPNLPEAFRPLPIWRVLNHTSGLPMIVGREDFNALSADEQLTLSYDQLLAMIASESLDFQPGEGWHYQQSGFVLLVHGLEQTLDTEFDRLLEEHVLLPARMKETGYAAGDDAAPAYRGTNDELEWQPAPYPRAMAAAGGYDTSGQDLVKLAKALSKESIVSRDYLEATLLDPDRIHAFPTSVPGEGYGMSMTVNIHGETTSIGHSGGGGLADFRYAPKEDVAIMVLTNRAGGTGVAGEISEAISTALFGSARRQETASD